MSIINLIGSYSDITGNALTPSSLLNMFDLRQDEEDNTFLNIFKTLDIDTTILTNPTNTSQISVIEPWWDSIGYSFYGDVDLWWLACVPNYVLNPFEEIYIGETLSLLSSDYVPYIQRDLSTMFSL